MKNNFTISQRNAIVENHLWCIKAVMKQNRALIRAAKLDTGHGRCVPAACAAAHPGGHVI